MQHPTQRPTARRPQPRLLALFIAVAFAGSVQGPAFAQAQANTPSRTAVHDFDLPVQKLDDALQSLALTSGYKLLYSQSLVEGWSSPSLSGRYTIESALQTLLDGTGLSYEVTADGLILIRARPGRVSATANGDVDTLDKVLVTADRDGLASQGYRSEIVSQLGPLGSRSVMETPFSMNIIPAELVQNRIASSADDLFRINPVVQLSNPQSRFYSGAILRGFPINQVNKVDGLSNTSFTGIDIEDKERIEVMTGLSGFLYGAGNVGGTVNYVLKRPTREPLARFILNNNSGENFSLQADLGGPIDSEGKVRYRFNALTQDGDTAVDYRSIKRALASVALDWTVGSALWQFNASHADYEMRGSEPYWTIPAGMPFPDAPDVDKYYGQAYTFTKSKQQNIGARLDWSISPSIFLRAALKHRTSEMDLAANNNFYVDADTYTTMGSQWEYPDNTDDNGYLFIDASFTTGALDHRLTTGMFVDRNRQTNFRTGGWLDYVEVVNGEPTPTLLSFDAPLHELRAPLPPPDSFPKYIAQRSQNSNFLVGDEIAFGNWTAMLGLTHTRLKITGYDEFGGRAWGYEASKTTPAATLLYSFDERFSVYGNYMESFEEGGQAGVEHNGYPVVNAGDVMPPLVSKQAEIGAKYKWGGMLLTGALFEIDRGREYYDISNPTSPRYVQDGRQVHRGFEFTSSGKPTEALTLIAGFTLLDPKIKKDPDLDGKSPENVAKTSIKLYAEYDVAAIPGLTLTGGAFHTGRQYADQFNLTTIDAFTTLDVGGRIVLPLKNERNLTLRMNINNLTGEDYWLLNRSLGPARSLMFSAQLDL